MAGFLTQPLISGIPHYASAFLLSGQTHQEEWEEVSARAVDVDVAVDLDL